jgi:hypothetical protein
MNLRGDFTIASRHPVGKILLIIRSLGLFNFYPRLKRFLRKIIRPS